MMTQAERALICMAGVFALYSSETFGISVVPNDYESIITNRNVFQLKPAPPPAPPPDPNPKPPAPKIILTGITTILGEPLALFKCTPPAAKGEQAKEKDYTLGLNQREDEIEVKSIDPVKGVVQVDDYGTLTNLTFEKDGAKVASGPPVNGAPNNAPGIPQPGPFNPGGGIRSLPQRNLRFPGGGFSGNSVTPQASGSVGTPVNDTGSTPSMNLDGRNLSMNGGAPQAGQPIVAGVADTDPEASALMLETMREATKEDVIAGKMGPLPVSQYTPPGALGTLPQENPNQPEAGSGGNPAGTGPAALPIPGRPFRPY